MRQVETPLTLLISSPLRSDHSWAFQKVNKQLRQALSVLRQQGYTGDGFYSRGRSLNPDYQGNIDALGATDGPTYTW